MKDKKWLVFFALLTAVGCVGAVTLVTQGHGVLGNTQFVTWGLLISSYEFFAASSTGVCMIIAFSFIRGIEPLAGVVKTMLVLAASLMVGGFSIIGLELGAPFHTINLILSPNLGSPIYWMMVIYGIYLALLIGTLICVLKQKIALGKTAALLAFIIAVIATGNMGALLGFVKARPFWYGPFVPVYFIITAMLSGITVIIIALYMKDGKRSVAIPQVSRLFSLLLTSTIVIVAFKMGSALFTSSIGKYESAMTLLAGPLSINFWVFEVVIGMAIPIMLLLTAKGRSERIFLAALMTFTGLFFMRYDFLVVGQILPIEVVNATVLPSVWKYHQYTPSFTEGAIIALGFGLAGLVYLLGGRLLSLDQASNKN